MTLLQLLLPTGKSAEVLVLPAPVAAEGAMCPMPMSHHGIGSSQTRTVPSRSP